VLECTQAAHCHNKTTILHHNRGTITTADKARGRCKIDHDLRVNMAYSNPAALPPSNTAACMLYYGASNMLQHSRRR
jgi:hypothetical protein